MQNNFDKLNEIFGVKPEGGEETAAKEEAREPETAPEQAAAPEPAGEETKVINPLRDSQPVPEKPAEPSPLVWRSSEGISPMKRETGFAWVWPKIWRCWAQVRQSRLRARVMAT